MNEWNEIMGDWYDELSLEMEQYICSECGSDRWEHGHGTLCERCHANKNAPEEEPLTDEELDDWAGEWDDSPVYED